MSETVMNLLKIGGLLLGTVSFVLVVYYLIGLLSAYAEKHKGEKISGRIFDAIEKLKMVTHVLATNAITSISKDTMAAMADGVITNKEVEDLIANVTAEVMKSLKTELPTLSKYFLGEGLESFIKNLVQKYVLDAIKDKLGFGAVPLAK